MFKNRVLPVLAGAAIVVGGLNVASYAANGHPLMLGQSNSESKGATLSNSGKGPALSLKAGKKSPALAVSNSKLVKNLNADKLDGQHASALATNVKRYDIPDATALPFAMGLAGLPAGQYMATIDVGVTTAVATPAICFLGDATTSIQVIGYGASNSAFAVVSAAGLFTVHAGQTPTLNCNNATAIAPAAQFQSHVTLTRVNKVTAGSAASKTAVRAPSIAR
jgi:hypothetical protein